jgi:hypothetical protein
LIASNINETEAKKLQSSNPDLNVIVGSGSGDGSEIETETKTPCQRHYCYVAANLAAKTKYIDIMLSMPMMECESRNIFFPDIDPSAWDEKMKFIDDPVAAHQMNIKDVLKNLCNVVLSEYFKLLNKKIKEEENHEPR